MHDGIKTIIRFFTTDPVRKILALILAFGLWLFVAIEGIYIYEREIPISYTNIPDSYVLIDSISKLKVTFNGKGKNLLGIWAAPPIAVCNLGEVVPGKNVISTKDLIIPVKDVNASYSVKFINIMIDEKMVKSVKPVIPIKGNLKAGYAISKIEIIDTVNITGAKKILQNLDKIYTESLNISNRSATFEKTLKIEPTTEPIEISPENVRILTVVDSSIQKVFTAVGINILKNNEQKVKIVYPLIDTLIISGARNRLEKLNKNDITIRIKTTDLFPGEYYLSPEVIIPDFIDVVYMKPQVNQVFVY